MPRAQLDVRFSAGCEHSESLSIHPAGLRYEARRLRKMGERRQLVALALAPQFLASVAGTQRYELVPFRKG